MTSLAVIKKEIESAKESFQMVAASTPELQLSFEREASFAMQIITKNDYAYRIAKDNPQSVRNAVINIANIGLTLNPALKLAYLVPRGKEIVLDTSYKGLIALGVRDKAIIKATATIVKEGDEFTYFDEVTRPEHPHNPLDEVRLRKKTIGAYCVAYLPDGSLLVEILARSQIEQAKNCSTMKDKKIWDDWYDDMAKKTVIKKGSKLWPSAPSLAKAVQILNEENGEGIGPQPTNADKIADVFNENVIDSEIVPDEPVNVDTKSTPPEAAPRDDEIQVIIVEMETAQTEAELNKIYIHAVRSNKNNPDILPEIGAAFNKRKEELNAKS